LSADTSDSPSSHFIEHLERSLMNLHQIFLDMATLIEVQGHQLNDIDSHVSHGSSFVRCDTIELGGRL
jgi:syntaxin 1B/2/3